MEMDESENSHPVEVEVFNPHLVEEFFDLMR